MLPAHSDLRNWILTAHVSLTAPDAARPGVEDGGWLLFFSHALTGDRSWLEILDAADIAAGPVCSVELPNVPIGFHATWVDAALVADADAAPVRAGL